MLCVYLAVSPQCTKDRIGERTRFDEEKSLLRKMVTITQTCRCNCGKVKFEVKDAPIKVNALCHCKFCSRARSSSPVHVILVPKDKVIVTEGEEFVVEKLRGGSLQVQSYCSECLGGIWQHRQGLPFRALFPATFHIEQGDKGAMLPKEYQPKIHVNYENRMMDWNDDLPKFLTKPTGPRVNNDGTECSA